MDKPVPKIGGITIERIPKTSTSCGPGTLPQSESPATEGFDSQSADDYGEDEFEDGDYAENEDWQEYDEGNNDLESEGYTENDEDEFMPEQNYQFNTSAPPNKGNLNTVLPPGITFERKKQIQPATATVKPNIKLPPGISFAKNVPQTTKQAQSSPNKAAVQSTLFAQRSPQKMAFPRQNSPMAKPSPPVRAVRPRAKIESPRMMINDFLEQRMKIGPNSLRIARPMSALRTSAAHPRAPRARAPRPNLMDSAFLEFPPGLRAPNVQTHKNVRSHFVTPPAVFPPAPIIAHGSGSDPDDDLPLKPRSAIPPFKIPQGIDISRKNLSRKPQGSNSSSDTLPLKSRAAIPPQSRIPSHIQLPAGISIKRKSDETPLLHNQSRESNDFHDEYEDGNKDVTEGTDDDYTDEMEFQDDEELEQDDPEIALSSPKQPPGVSLQPPPSNSDEPPRSQTLCESQPPVLPPLSTSENPNSGHEDFKDDEELEEYDEESGDIEQEEYSELAEYQGNNETSDFNENKEPDITDNETDKHDDSEKMHENDESIVPTEEVPSDEFNEGAADENSEECDEPGDHDEKSNILDDGDKNFDPSSEIDFEALIATPVPIVANSMKSVASPADENKNDLEEKADLENLMEMMTKGEIEGEIEEEEDDDKKGVKRKADDDLDGETDDKRLKEEEDEEDVDQGDIDKTKVTGTHLRKNIREVMDETKLDETTLAAQRQEAERLKRLSEQQRIMREVKRQMEISKAAEKAQNQNNVLSLLRGNTDLTLKKRGSIPGIPSSTRTQDSVLLKMGNGQQACLNDKMRQLLKIPEKSQTMEQNARSLLNRGMLSSSVTIAPIKKEPGEVARKGDVVTLSSDEDDTDDDCVVLSDAEPESEPDDDPNNSGMHTADKYNIPDDQGQVLVNFGHPPEEADVFLAPQIASIIKPHQIGGVRFLYDNIIESPGRYENSPGFGCILAHSMGLGKTLQIVSFSDVFLRHTSAKKILCIMPINTIQNWQAEFNMWLPKENPSGADIRCRDFDVYVVNESSKNIHSRGKVILEWHKNGGVLLMGYELFRLLSLKKPIKSKRKRPDEVEEKNNQDLVENVYAALVKPGPDLVICDEGHRIKNSHATTSQALKQIRTKRRVVLTGYPLQNNLLEYWCMVDFVRPNYLGSKTEFSNMFERPIQNGQCIDSTPQDKRLMRFRAHVLHSLLEGFVQRRSHAVLQQVLPHKNEYVLLLRFTPFQSKLYKTFMNDVVRTVAVPNPLKAFAVCCKIWNHPDVLYNFLKKKGEQRDLDLEDPFPLSVARPPLPGDIPPPNPAWPKRGPGSRGGKVRQRKAKNSPPMTANPPKAPAEPLPSMNLFQVQNTPTSGSGQNYAAPTQYQDSMYNQQIEPYGRPSQADTLYKGYEMAPPQGENTFSEQPLNANYRQDAFYGSQDQFSQSSGNASSSQDQYYQRGNEGYDYNQSADLNSDFSNQMSYSDSGFGNSNFSNEYTQQQNAWGSNWGASSQGGYSSSSDEFLSPPKFTNYEEKKDEFISPFSGAAPIGDKTALDNAQSSLNGNKAQIMTSPMKSDNDDKKEEREIKKDEISYEWANAAFKNYVAGVVENSSKMEVFLVIVQESIIKGDRILVFSQSLLTLDLIEDYLQKRKVPGIEEYWAKNRNYFRLDGSTAAMEREKLINEFNKNINVQIFLVSTRAGSLGINLVGANRVVVFDASWNPCHDTQAVCRVYRYGQKKPCFVYRLVMDCSLEKKIYDRQVNKQGMADRIVDELNPDAHLALKDVTNLCWDDQEETTVADFSDQKEKYHDDIVKLLLEKHSLLFSRVPFQHESLLIDRKEKKLSKAEKQLAKRSYELEKQAANNPRGMHHLFPNPGTRVFSKPIASVKPMQSGAYGGYSGMASRSKWIPAEVWQKQGMSAQEMTLPLDVVIPTNSPDKTSIVLKAGQRVMVLKSPKGIYMQLETGKIIAIRTAFKLGGTATSSAQDKSDNKKPSTLASALKNNPNLTITKSSPSQRSVKLPAFLKPSSLDRQAAAVNMAASKGRVFSTKNRPTLPVKKPASPAKTNSGSSDASDEATSSSHDQPMNVETVSTAPEKVSTPLTHADTSAPWNESEMPEETNNLASTPTEQDLPPSSSLTDDLPQSTAPSEKELPEEKDNVEIKKDLEPQRWPNADTKKEGDPQNPWQSLDKKDVDPQNPWPKPGYPMDPYGNYFPGYPGYYAPPMPGYDPYLGYAPMPPVKSESTGEGTPPPAPIVPPTRPPMYPPYHAPFPYHPYNYPPFPPQGQPPASNPQQPKAEPVEASTNAFAPPPYGPRPPYPQPSTGPPPPGYYPNYPPYPPRPYHDPNYPYPNYNPYMPPGGYGYPVQNTPANRPATDGNVPDTPQQ